MQRLFLVLVFAVSLVLKLSAYGADNPTVINNYYGNNGQAKADTQTADAAKPAAPAPVAVAPSAPIQNTINVSQPAPAQTVAYQKPEADEELTAEHHDDRRAEKIAIIPMLGGSGFQGAWNAHVSNSYSLGVALEIPVNPTLAIEVEGDYGRYSISYGVPQRGLYSHTFNQYSIGGNAKIYLTRGLINPYLGAGIMGLDYENMNHGPFYGYMPYSTWIGAGQLLAGADVAVSDSVAIGGRAAWVVPIFNRPLTEDDGVNSYPGYEDAGAINTSFFRFMGTCRLSF